MTNPSKRHQVDVETTPAGVLAGLFLSLVAARFARAAWDAAQREAARRAAPVRR